MGYEFWAGDNIVYTKNDNLVSIWTQILQKKPQHMDMRCLCLRKDIAIVVKCMVVLIGGKLQVFPAAS